MAISLRIVTADSVPLRVFFFARLVMYFCRWVWLSSRMGYLLPTSRSKCRRWILSSPSVVDSRFPAGRAAKNSRNRSSSVTTRVSCSFGFFASLPSDIRKVITSASSGMVSLPVSTSLIFSSIRSFRPIASVSLLVFRDRTKRLPPKRTITLKLAPRYSKPAITPLPYACPATSMLVAFWSRFSEGPKKRTHRIVRRALV